MAPSKKGKKLQIEERLKPFQVLANPLAVHVSFLWQSYQKAANEKHEEVAQILADSHTVVGTVRVIMQHPEGRAKLEELVRQYGNG